MSADREETEHSRIRSAILALCAPNDPTVAARTPSAGTVWAQRTDAAEARAEALQEKNGLPEAKYGREILWHPLFPAEYLSSVTTMPLYEVAEFHEQLPGWCNQGRPLDAHDLGYLSDVLTEALAKRHAAPADLKLRRALSWVERVLAAGPPTQAAAPAPLPVEEKPLMQVAA